jgi:hypothetical protein
MLNSTQGVPEKVRWTCHVVFRQSENARGDALVCADALDKNRVEYTGMYIVTPPINEDLLPAAKVEEYCILS